MDHYLDDFITIGPPAAGVCGENLERILVVCRVLGVPMAMDKLEGPSYCLTFLGIEIDTRAGVLGLPADKLKEAMTSWTAQKSCWRHQLESLIGTLQHACQEVKPGRAFLRRMIDFFKGPERHKGSPPHSPELRLLSRFTLVVHVRGELERGGCPPMPAILCCLGKTLAGLSCALVLQQPGTGAGSTEQVVPRSGHDALDPMPLLF